MTIEVGDVVVASGHTGRWEITRMKNHLVSLRLLAQSVHGPVEVGHEMHEVPASTLTLLKKKGE